MNSSDWLRAIQEIIDQLSKHYDQIGRKNGAPFLGLVYPPELEIAVMREWRAQSEALKPDVDILVVDALDVTGRVLAARGADNVVAEFKSPWPGSNPEPELGDQWARAVAREVRDVLTQRPQNKPGRPAVVVQNLAALYPTSGPRDVLQQLWDGVECCPKSPVITFIPGDAGGGKLYRFLGKCDELMYRGDLV